MNTNVKTAVSGLLVAFALAPLAAAAQQRTQIPGQDKILSERATDIFSVGAEDGEEWELLSGVRQVAFDANDNLYVLDGNNHRVLVFNSSGRFVRKFGKQGGGPGEFMAPLGLVVTTDGMVVIPDLGRRAFSLFKPDGTFVNNVPFDEGELPGTNAGGLQAHPKSGVVGRVGMVLNLGGGRGFSADAVGGGTGERKSPVKWWTLGATADGNAADGARVPAGTPTSAKLYEFTLPSLNPTVREASGGDGQRRMMVSISPPVWQMEPYSGVLPTGGLAFVHEKDYRVHLTNPGGTVERVVERPMRARKATEKDKELAMQRRREQMTGSSSQGIRMTNINGQQSFSSAGPPRELPSVEEMLRTTTFEETIPVVRGLHTDPQGRIWVLRTAADFGQRGPVDILYADGRYVGTLASARLPDAVSRSGRAAFIERDEMGVEKVAVRRIPTSWQ